MLLKLKELTVFTKKNFPKSWGGWSFKEKLKFLLRSLLSPQVTRHYLTAISRLPQRQLLDKNEYFLGKIHRPYLATPIKAKLASEMIIYHHRYLAALLPTDLLTQLYTKGLTLCQFSAKNESYSIEIQVDPQFNKEGELTLVFYNHHQQYLMSLSCSIVSCQAQTCLIIAGLQGGGGEQANQIKQATKNCYGLFPKRILFESLQIVAQQLNIHTIYGVSNESHIYRSQRYRKRKQHCFVADYNQFWQEMGGTFEPTKGMFNLSNRLTKKALSAIPSKKRAQYKRRYHLQRSIERKISCVLRAIVQR